MAPDLKRSLVDLPIPIAVVPYGFEHRQQCNIRFARTSWRTNQQVVQWVVGALEHSRLDHIQRVESFENALAKLDGWKKNLEKKGKKLEKWNFGFFLKNNFIDLLLKIPVVYGNNAFGLFKFQNFLTWCQIKVNFHKLKKMEIFFW